MMATLLPVPTILNMLNDSNNKHYFVDQDADSPAPRAKKRRLDHLSWEEKIQRKKLKNRVAAQTSRDRKKAKFEQMEMAIQHLFNKNETLLAECEKLREANERLQAENTELHKRLECDSGSPPSTYIECFSIWQLGDIDTIKFVSERPAMPLPKPVCRVRARERINRVPPSAERNERLHSSGFGERQTSPPPEDNPGLPSLPDLLDELESDAVDLNALEQLTQTLLDDIARDLESAAQKAADQDSTPCEEDTSRKMVGTPPEQVESGRTDVLEQRTSVEQDISEYLLLHHNYAKIRPKETRAPIRKKSTSNPRRLKTIRPKTHAAAAPKPEPTVESPSPTVQPKIEPVDEFVYGTFDEDTNTLTLVVYDDDIALNEVVIGENIVSPSDGDVELDASIPTAADDSNSLTVPSTYEGGTSPKSDLGYESLDSPLSGVDLDNWDQSVSELFPALF